MNPLATFGAVPPVVDSAWHARLKRRLEAIEQLTGGLRPLILTGQGSERAADDLCAGLRYVLGADDIAEQLRQIENPARPPKPTLEDFEEAQRRVETFQKQLDALEKMLKGMPEDTREYFETTQRPMLTEALRQAEQWRSSVQRAMEATDALQDVERSIPGAEAWRVLDAPPTFIFVLVRPAGPERPGCSQLADDGDEQTVLTFVTEERARTVAARLNEQAKPPWEVGAMLLQPVERVTP